MKNKNNPRIIRGVEKAWFSDTIRAGFVCTHTAPFRKFGFTLAEVLITLGIIGIVAAMTLPTLVQKNRKQVVETRLSKFYSVMNQAIARSELDNGPREYWTFPSEGGMSNMDWYNKYMKNYVKALKVTETNINTQPITPIAIYFADGSAAIYGTTWLFFPEAKNMSDKKFGDDESITYVDTQESGRKWFTFVFSPINSDNKYYYKKGIEPFVNGWNGTVEQLYNHPNVGCRPQVSGTTERAYCAKVIQMNGWKIPKEYPLNF